MAVKFVFGKPPIFENRVLTYSASKYPEMHAQAIIHSHLSLPHVVGAPGAFPS